MRFLRHNIYAETWYQEELAGVSSLICGGPSTAVSLSMAEQFRALSAINFTSVIDTPF